MANFASTPADLENADHSFGLYDDFSWFVTAHNWTSTLTDSGTASVTAGTTDLSLGAGVDLGATGAVGTVTLRLLAERGYEDVRAFASARSAGSELSFGDRSVTVEEATPEALGAGDVGGGLHCQPHINQAAQCLLDRHGAHHVALIIRVEI